MSSALISAGGSGQSVPPPMQANHRGAPGRIASHGETPEERGFAPFKVRADSHAGSLDELEAALMRYCATTTGDVVVDGSDLRFVDGRAVSVLVDLELRLRPLGRRLVVRGFGARGQEEFPRVGLWASLRLDGGPNGPDMVTRDRPRGPPAHG